MIDMISLELTEDEAAAVAVALVSLIWDTCEGPSHERWRRDASAVARRLDEARGR